MWQLGGSLEDHGNTGTVCRGGYSLRRGLFWSRQQTDPQSFTCVCARARVSVLVHCVGVSLGVCLGVPWHASVR